MSYRDTASRSDPRCDQTVLDGPSLGGVMVNAEEERWMAADAALVSADAESFDKP